MVEALVAGAVVAGGIAILSRRLPASSGAFGPAHILTGATLDASSDLPCPWCRAATSETDTHCPNCHQPFG